MIEVIVYDTEVLAIQNTHGEPKFPDPIIDLTYSEWGSYLKPLLIEKGAPPEAFKLGRRGFQIFYDPGDEKEGILAHHLFRFMPDGSAPMLNPEIQAEHNAAVIARQNKVLSRKVKKHVRHI